jgi:glycosyltransferase involved in cell wall biosynthesis
MNLIDAFQQIKDPNYELRICGVGDSEDAIKAAAQKDERIHFWGKLPREQVLEWQSKATVLVNPRQNNEEFTKYSFPSKTMEYLSSGVPLVAYKLDGIPDEYDSYIFYVKENSLSCLADTIRQVCEMPESKRAAAGKAGREFVLNQKNSAEQVKKITNLLQSV